MVLSMVRLCRILYYTQRPVARRRRPAPAGWREVRSGRVELPRGVDEIARVDDVIAVEHLPVAAANRSVSSESFAWPLGQPRIDCRRKSSGGAETRIGSATAAMSRSCPATPSPP